jgi:hypothetical protein
MWYALTSAIVYRSLGSWCPAIFACLVYSLDGPKRVRSQLRRGQDHFNMAQSCFLLCIKPLSSSFMEGAMLLCATLWLVVSHSATARSKQSSKLVAIKRECGEQTRSLCLRLKNLFRFHESSSFLTFQTSISLRIYLLHGTRPLAPFNFRPPCIRLHIPITAIA